MTEKRYFEAFNKIFSEEEYLKIIDSEGFKYLKRFRREFYSTRDKRGGKKQKKVFDYKTCWRMFWSNLKPKEKLAIIRIPHFDAKVFYKITGIYLKF